MGNDSNLDGVLQEMEGSDQVFVSVILLWIALIVIGNVWLIAGSLRAKLPQTDSVHIYVISIAASSVVIALVVLPVQVIGYTNLLNETMCRVTAVALSLAIGGNIFSQIAAAYYQYRQESKGEKIPMKCQVKRVMGLWLVSLIYAVKQWFLIGLVTDPVTGAQSCGIVVDKSVSKFFIIADFLILGAIPCKLVSGFTIKTICVSKNDKRAAVMLCVLLVSYLTLTSPLSLVEVLMQLEMVTVSHNWLMMLIVVAFSYEWMSLLVVLIFDKATRAACVNLCHGKSSLKMVKDPKMSLSQCEDLCESRHRDRQRDRDRKRTNAW